MSLFSTVADALRSPASDADASEQSKGSYWCHDCGERIREADVEGDDAPACPECGDEMAFERSPDSAGCAC